jgi:hypothetical protein
MTDEALFALTRSGPEEAFQPLPRSRSGWGEQIRGMAVTGLLARGTEGFAASLGLPATFRPARFTVDLFRPAAATSTQVHSKAVRRGRRLCVIDSSFVQDGVEAARSRTLLFHEQEPPGGQVWAPDDCDLPRPPTLEPTSEDARLFHSRSTGWTQVAESPEGDVRRASWNLPTPLVEDEPLSGFVFAASIADVGNVVSNWGDRGLRFINADITLALSRVPRADGVGLVAVDRHEDAGIAVGTTTMFDRDGRCGSVVTVALANAAHAVDPRTKSARVDVETAAVPIPTDHH